MTLSERAKVFQLKIQWISCRGVTSNRREVEKDTAVRQFVSDIWEVFIDRSVHQPGCEFLEFCTKIGIQIAMSFFASMPS